MANGMIDKSIYHFSDAVNDFNHFHQIHSRVIHFEVRFYNQTNF